MQAYYEYWAKAVCRGMNYPIRESTFSIALLLFEHGLHIAHISIELVVMVHVSINLLLQVLAAFSDSDDPSSQKIMLPSAQTISNERNVTP